MGLKYIIDQVASEIGIDVSQTSARNKLIAKVNEAAKEIYGRKDIPVALQECFVRTTPNSEMALPPFIGQLRAMRPGTRDYCTKEWVLHTMWPRYNKVEWVSAWKNWRDKGTACTAVEFNNVAPGAIEIAVADGTVEVTLVGENDDSNNVIETITLSATSQAWTKTFVKFNRIYKNKRSNHNIIIKDADGNEISMIYADQLDARFKIVDVSEFPTDLCCDASCGDGTYIMEVLFKPILPVMQEDSDFFPVDGYDEVIVLKTKQLYTELKVGEEDRALLIHQKVKDRLRDIAEDRTPTHSRKLGRKASPVYDRNKW